MKRFFFSAAGLAATLLLCAPGTARAQSGMGDHFSGAVDGDSASPFWNPAAMSLSKRTQAQLGVNLSVIQLGYDAPATEGQSTTTLIAPQPFVGAVSDPIGKWRFGLTAGVPYAAGVKWSPDQAEGAITRFYANHALIAHVVVTPAVSYQATPWLSLGASANVSYSRIRAEFDKDFAGVLNAAATGESNGIFPAGTDELAAPAEFESSGVGFGAAVGFLAQPNSRWRIGASIHSPIIAKTSGRVTATYPQELYDFVAAAAPDVAPPDLNGDVDMRLDVPLAVYSAIAFSPKPGWEITADYRYRNTSDENELDVIISDATTPDLASTELIRGSSDRQSLGLRLIREVPSRGLRLLLRSRVENNSVHETLHTPSNPDFAKLEVGTGISWQLNRRFTMRAHYSHFFLQTVNVDRSLHRPLANQSLDAYNHPQPLGRYKGSGDQVSLGLSAVF